MPEGFEDGIGNFTGAEGKTLPLGYRAHRARLVGDFVDGAQIATDCAAWDLTGDAEHRGRARVGGSESGSGVVEAHARDYQSDARLTRRASVAVGHVGCSLFVAGGNHADAGFVS